MSGGSVEWKCKRVCLVCGLEHTRGQALNGKCAVCAKSLRSFPTCYGGSCHLDPLPALHYLCSLCGASAPPLGFDKGARVRVSGRLATIESVSIIPRPFAIGVYVRYDDGILDLVSHRYVVLEEDMEVAP